MTLPPQTAAVLQAVAPAWQSLNAVEEQQKLPAPYRLGQLLLPPRRFLCFSVGLLSAGLHMNY